jgi:1-pyrroline-5-carboxylate dehydrogenase
MTDPLAGLPRVTYANAAADFSALHAVFDAELPRFAARALGRDHANRVGDADDAGGVRFAVASPIDRRDTLGTLVGADAAAVDRAVAAARGGAAAWRATPWPQRAAQLRRVAAAIRRRRLDFAMAALLEVGKSRLEAMGEVEEAIDLIEYYCGQLEQAQGWERALLSGPGGEAGHDRLRPYGVFAVIAPFNYPFALAIGMTTGALLGGNAVVLKPAPGAALSAPMLAQAFGEAGLPAGVFNLLCGDRDAGARLAGHPGVDGIAFTGSHEVGMQLMRAAVAGPYPRPVLAELGGKNAAFVTASADLDAAASGVARSAFGLSGQKCSSCSKVYVQAEVRAAFEERLRAFAARLAVGDPRQAATFTGPVIGEASARRFEAAVAGARAAGAQVAFGGARLGGGADAEAPGGAPLPWHGAYLAPTLVTDAPPGHEVNRRELFVPLLSLQAFGRLDEAIADANRSPLGLTAGVYTRDEAELALFDDRIEAGVLYVNRASGATTGAWPGFQTFCGWKGSGATGKGGLGPHYVQQFMREQSRTRGA